MKFIEIHSADSNKTMIINTRFIAEIENTPHGTTNIWLTTESGTMRLIRTSHPYEWWYQILDVI